MRGSAAFSILALLAPNLDYSNRADFHKDHLHPKEAFSKKKLAEAGIRDDDLEFYSNKGNWNSILNLRHLDGNENKAKGKSSLIAWAQQQAKQLKCP